MSLTVFKKIVGHKPKLAELEKDLQQGNLAHAYLFAGPSGVGKFTIARTMAKALQCAKNSGEAACGECDNCLEIEKGIHADTIEMADNGQSIKIEEIREILNKVNLTRNGSYKIILIKNIERMGIEAANALLKTLEDPPPQVVFMLTTNHLKEILPTIISRVRLMQFGALKKTELLDFLTSMFPMEDPENGEKAARFADGKAGLSLRYLGDPELMNEQAERSETIRNFLYKPDLAEQFAFVTAMVQKSKDEEDKGQINEFLETFMAVMRSEMLELSGKTNQEPVLKRAVRAIKEAQKAQGLLKNNINTKLLLENLMLALNE